MFQLIEKISYPYIVLKGNNICFLNKYFTDTFLVQNNINFSTITKFEYEWEIHQTCGNLVIINLSSSLIMFGKLTSEFLEANLNSDDLYRVYRINNVINPIKTINSISDSYNYNSENDISSNNSLIEDNLIRKLYYQKLVSYYSNENNLISGRL